MAAVVLTPECAARGRVGPVPWVAFESLALAAERDDTGWIAVLGVRDIATTLGMNKDTAARAVATLSAAGLVTRERLAGANGTRRSGYRLHLPAGTELCPADRPVSPDSAEVAARPIEADADPCPTHGDDHGRPAEPDVQRGPNGSDAEMSPSTPDGETLRTSNRGPSPDGLDGGVRPTKSRREPPNADTVAVVAPQSDATIESEGDSARVGSRTALSGRTSRAAQPERQRRVRRSSVAQNEAQGQLFELVTIAERQDRPR